MDQEAITAAYNLCEVPLKDKKLEPQLGDQAAVLGGADQGGEENVAGREGAGTQEYRGPTGSPVQGKLKAYRPPQNTFTLIRHAGCLGSNATN
jgi:hypothetical protein